MVADIIFPAFAGAYIISIFLLPVTLLAIASEVVVFRIRESQVPLGQTVLLVVVANVVSWLVGIAATWYLPSGLIPTVLPNGITTVEQGPLWSTYSYASFPVAWFLSCVIEYGVLYPMRRWAGFSRLFGTVVLANVVSYPVFGLGALLIWFAFLRRA